MTQAEAIQGAFALVSGGMKSTLEVFDHSDCVIPDDNQGDYNNYDIWKDSELEF